LTVKESKTFVIIVVGDDGLPHAFESMADSLRRFGVPAAQIDHGMISVRRTFNVIQARYEYSLAAHAEVVALREGEDFSVAFEVLFKELVKRGVSAHIAMNGLVRVYAAFDPERLEWIYRLDAKV